MTETRRDEGSTTDDRQGARAFATFGAGCFWCVEAIFEGLKGVHAVESGYTGGRTERPTYEEVCSGSTGHVEVVRVAFDPDVISFEDLLEVFWRTHDPTTKDRQGADVGSQYRSAIFVHDDEQRAVAEASLARTDASDLWPARIVTVIEPLGPYWPAEGYHQDFYRLNPNQPYCRFVIDPKMQKLRKEFSERLA